MNEHIQLLNSLGSTTKAAGADQNYLTPDEQDNVLGRVTTPNQASPAHVNQVQCDYLKMSSMSSGCGDDGGNYLRMSESDNESNQHLTSHLLRQLSLPVTPHLRSLPSSPNSDKNNNSFTLGSPRRSPNFSASILSEQNESIELGLMNSSEIGLPNDRLMIHSFNSFDSSPLNKSIIGNHFTGTLV